MGSDDFIKLDSPSHSEGQVEENGYNESQAKETSSSTSKEKVGGVNHIETEDFTDGSNIKAHNENIEEEDSQHVQEMNLEDDDFMLKGPILQENVQFVDSFSTLERVDESESKFATNFISTNSVSNTTMNKLGVDESRVVAGLLCLISKQADGKTVIAITGFKRARTSSNHNLPSVHVVYNCLTRESKNKLMELMQQWSQWQEKHQSSSNVPGEVTLESGEDTYFAALHVGSERTNAVSFWLDNQGRKENIGGPVKLDGDMVPLYDREFTLGLTTLDGSTNPESGLQALEASRCFNCGSYSHALKECPKPRDNTAINNARKQHSSKRNQNAGSRSQTRYYQKSSGKFDDLKAGVLGPETRECLGIGELDPPPWLHRMRELGYPPGYLDNVEDQPSGIIIFADEEEDTECEEGELLERSGTAPLKKRMTVEFPGINAPIPENADNWRWATPQSSYNHSAHSNSNRSSDSHRGRHHDQTESTEFPDDGPPGSVHGFAAFSRPGYSPRYSSQDHNSTPRSPHLGRSLSDRSWPSPMLYESSPIHSPHSPHLYSSMARQSPQYHSPVTSIDYRSHENSYRLNSNARERDQHRQDHHRNHHRR